MIVSQIIIEVEEAHTDDLGHLNHVQAVEYLERAREDWYVRCGLWDSESERRLGTVVVNIDFNYRRECFLGERLTVVTRPETMGRKSFVLAHEIIKSSGDIAVEGQATSVIMDLDAREAISVPPCLAENFSARS